MPAGSITATGLEVTLPGNAGSGATTYTFTLTATGAAGTTAATATAQVTVAAAGTCLNGTLAPWSVQLLSP